MGTHCQEHNRFVFKALAEAVQALLHATTFLTDHEDDAKTTAYRRTAVATQIQCPANIAQNFGAGIRIGQNSIYPPLI
jgi:hypothetical protein